MSVLGVLPFMGKSDPALRNGSAEDIETPPINGEIDVSEFDAEIAPQPDAAAQIVLDLSGDVEAKIDADAPATPDNTLEVILQSWTGITSDVADKPAIQPESILAAPTGPAVAQTQDLVDEVEGTDADVDLTKMGAEGAASDTIALEKPATTLLRQSVGALPDTPAIATKTEAAPTASRTIEPPPPTPEGAPARAATAPATVIRQISDALVSTTNDQIDIALSPEELGRIRMTISGREGGQHIVIWAERPEVLDQLRRNTTTLMQEFSDAGMQDMTFEFRDNRPDQQDAEWHSAQIADVTSDAPMPPSQAQPHIYSNLAQGPRIDIRI